MTHASSRSARVLLLCGLASFGIYGGASCGSSETTSGATSSSSGGTGGAASQPGLVFEGDANDEALAAIMAKDGAENPATYAVFDSPAEGAVYPADSTPKFTWHMNGQPGIGGTGGAGGGAFLLAPAAPARRASLGPLLDLFGAERSAAAHGNPVTGLGYLLLFSSDKDAKLLRVFTTNTSYSPSPAAMDILKGVGTVQVWILTGVFDNNALTPDGGPFRGPWTSFEVTK
jgi:hypothetical protein